MFLVFAIGVFLRRTGFAFLLMLYQALNVAVAVYAVVANSRSVLTPIVALVILVVFVNAYRALNRSEFPDVRSDARLPQNGGAP